VPQQWGDKYGADDKTRKKIVWKRSLYSDKETHCTFVVMLYVNCIFFVILVCAIKNLFIYLNLGYLLVQIPVVSIGFCDEQLHWITSHGFIISMAIMCDSCNVCLFVI
jgi:hypothetical protein